MKVKIPYNPPLFNRNKKNSVCPIIQFVTLKMFIYPLNLSIKRLSQTLCETDVSTVGNPLSHCAIDSEVNKVLGMVTFFKTEVSFTYNLLSSFFQCFFYDLILPP